MAKLSGISIIVRNTNPILLCKVSSYYYNYLFLLRKCHIYATNFNWVSIQRNVLLRPNSINIHLCVMRSLNPNYFLKLLQNHVKSKFEHQNNLVFTPLVSVATQEQVNQIFRKFLPGCPASAIAHRVRCIEGIQVATGVWALHVTSLHAMTCSKYHWIMHR